MDGALVSADLDRLLDAHPRWVARSRARARAWWGATPGRRRVALTTLAGLWVLGEFVVRRDQVAPVRRVLLAMVVLDSVATYVWVSTGLAVEGNPFVAAVMDLAGDGLGLTLRTVWSALLVLALCWLAERRAAVRPALVLVLLPLAAVTLLHVAALGWVWSVLLG